MARSGDIPLEPPTVKSPATVPAVEDRSYLGFIAVALGSALLGGFVYGTWVPLAATGTVWGGERVPWMIQAHGWVQLQGWAGLFVAGMAVRLIPRFAGRKPIPRRVTLPLLFALGVPVVLRVTLQTWAEDSLADAVAVVIGVATAVGCLGVAAVLAYTLAKGRKPREPWRYLAWAGTAWWAAWGLLALWFVPGGDAVPGLLEHQDNDALLWVVMLGPIGNFVWGVQSRSVPIFFGRKTPTVAAIVVPMIALNLGAVLLLRATLDDRQGYVFAGGGFALAGGALAVLPLLAGAVWGEAKRLRPRARPAARFILAANVAAMLAGVLMTWAGFWIVVTGEEYAPWAAVEQRDAARHLLGLGTITMLILGMARLVAPVFALERTESGVPPLLERLPFWLLIGAMVLRAGVPLLGDALAYEAGRHTLATAGVLGWLAIAIFAVSVLRAVRAEPGTKRAIEAAAGRPR